MPLEQRRNADSKEEYRMTVRKQKILMGVIIAIIVCIAVVPAVVFAVTTHWQQKVQRVFAEGTYECGEGVIAFEERVPVQGVRLEITELTREQFLNADTNVLTCRPERYFAVKLTVTVNGEEKPVNIEGLPHENDNVYFCRVKYGDGTDGQLILRLEEEGIYVINGDLPLLERQ